MPALALEKETAFANPCLVYVCSYFSIETLTVSVQIVFSAVKLQHFIAHRVPLQSINTMVSREVHWLVSIEMGYIFIYLSSSFIKKCWSLNELKLNSAVKHPRLPLCCVCVKNYRLISFITLCCGGIEISVQFRVATASITCLNVYSWKSHINPRRTHLT